ncbi:MAG: flagellar biosynthesis protein FlhA [Sorangiineae bacterium NIC37A_2]|nr:MAG: flagellar biosynthesis protein FlhA [Sorangiineae bacterium NIC37A_2]
MASPVRTSKEPLSDSVVPLLLVGVVLMMVLPLPSFLIDALLALSLAISIGVFLIGLYMEQPLQFSSFPAVILVATLLRLSLNVATTRLILLRGHEGTGAAGHVIETFGKFVVEGNVVVGLIVFLILVVINFVVITKGAGRVAEVAARFALDGMPGKQMAIDADMNAGAISPDVARARRRDLEREADFFGAMDGASKFVKGDAIASLLITAINLIGGLLLAVGRGLGLGEAAETFSILSIGDALVSQMPALLMSTAAGVVVTRSATGEQLGRAFATQLLGSRRAMLTTGVVVAAMSLLPGMPMVPFLALSGGIFYYARKRKEAVAQEADEVPVAPAVEPGSMEDIEGSLPLEMLTLEVGYELLYAVDPKMGGMLVDRIQSLRKQVAMDLGIIMAPVHIRDNLELEPGMYRFLLLGTEIAHGTIRSGHLLAIDPSGQAPAIAGELTRDPAFGSTARWIHQRDKEMASALGYTVVDATTIIATHLAEIVRAHAHELLGRAELQHLLDNFAKSHPKLTEDLIPNILSLGDVLKVLRNLLREGVPIRNLRSILEGLCELGMNTKDPEQLTEALRQRLSRQLTAVFKGMDGQISALVLDGPVEEMFRRSLRDIASGVGGALDPEQTRQIGDELEQAVQAMIEAGKAPLCVTSPDIRRYVRAFAERRSPRLAVLSFRELEPQTPVRPFATISFAPRSHAA